MRLRTILSLLFVFCAPALIAQIVTIGNPYVEPEGYLADPVQGVTYIDLVHPATASGLLTQADFVYWAWEPPCRAAAKIKFFRRTGETLTMIAERGPFDDTTPVQLLPPVLVRAGDLIGAADLKPNCGGGFVLTPASAGQYLAYPTDVTGTVSMSAGRTATGTLVVSAMGTAGEFAARIIPVVGSAPGSHGAQWNTSVQLLNPHSVAATGQLLFRPERATATAAYASTPYSLDPGATQTILDLGALFGINGLGSLDVMVKPEGVPPVIVAHIQHVNSSGAVGTTEEGIDPSDFGHVLVAGVTGHLITPHSATASRFNIGVRTLESGATITATLQTSGGVALQTVTKAFPANYFEQFSPTELFAVSFTGGESIAVTVVNGSAIVYGSATDNVTNDASILYVSGFKTQ